MMILEHRIIIFGRNLNHSIFLYCFLFDFSLPSQDPSLFDDHHSISTNTPNEITSAPAVDFELNVQIQIASGSCNLYTRRDLISTSSKPQQSQQSQQTQTTIGSIIYINKIEYQVSQFSLPGVDVDANYNSKHNNTINSALNKRASF